MKTKRKTRTITVEHRSLPTPERLVKAEGYFQVGGDERTGTVLQFTDGSLGRLYARLNELAKTNTKINRDDLTNEYIALQKYYHHWHHGGFEISVGSVDMDRIFAPNFNRTHGLAKTERQINDRQQYERATKELGHRAKIVVDNVVCAGTTLEIAGYALGWTSKPQAIAAASEMIRDAGVRLARLWGMR